jgi:HK97 family phage major capsid protein
MDIQEVKGQFEESLKPLRSKLEGLTEDLKSRPNSEAVKTAVDEVLAKIGEMKAEHDARIKGLEAKASKSTLQGEEEAFESIGDIVTKSDLYKEFSKVGAMRRTPKIDVGSFHKTAIVNATGQNQPLVAPQRAGMFAPLQQRLTIRNILTQLPTNSNLIEFVKESSSTNNAAPQGKGSSPQVYENVAKAESAMAFQLAFEPVQTVAHWIPVSRQVQDDAPALQAYIDGRMTYFLKLKEEDQLLNGTGAGGDLNGLITQATDYDTTLNVASPADTKIDTLRHAMLQVELANGSVSAFVFNPSDWHDIELIKTAGVASGQYIFSNPHQVGVPTIWGRPVVTSQSITAEHFLTGDFPLACALYDRMQSTVEVSRDYSDFFVKNMMAILCEERLALVVYRPEALVQGAFPS